MHLKRVVVRDPHKPRPTIPRELISTDMAAAIHDPQIHVIVELIGGTGIAKQVVLESFAAGKHVVTANKALLAQHGPEVFEAARQHERAVGFEASVAGGIPIIRAVAESLAANQITAIQGILNGTSNFILTSMAERHTSYAKALAEAQRLGYAEADPTLDVDGSDAAHKLAILAQIAFGVIAPVDKIERLGIADMHAMDLRFAHELGYTIKLLAEAWVDGTEVALHVAPVLLRRTDMLAQVRGAFNAVQVVGDAVGEIMFQGAGAALADGQFGRRRRDRHGGRPSAANVSSNEVVGARANAASVCGHRKACAAGFYLRRAGARQAGRAGRCRPRLGR